MTKSNGFDSDRAVTGTGEKSIVRTQNLIEKGIDHRAPLSSSERELLNEVERAVRTINFGSIVLTIHEGRLVEISKTVRLRNPPTRGE